MGTAVGALVGTSVRPTAGALRYSVTAFVTATRSRHVLNMWQNPLSVKTNAAQSDAPWSAQATAHSSIVCPPPPRLNRGARDASSFLSHRSPGNSSSDVNVDSAVTGAAVGSMDGGLLPCMRATTEHGPFSRNAVTAVAMSPAGA